MILKYALLNFADDDAADNIDEGVVAAGAAQLITEDLTVKDWPGTDEALSNEIDWRTATDFEDLLNTMEDVEDEMAEVSALRALIQDDDSESGVILLNGDEVAEAANDSVGDDDDEGDEEDEDQEYEPDLSADDED